MMNMFLRQIAPDLKQLGDDDQVVATVLALQCAYRFHQRRHEPLEEVEGMSDCVFLTNGWVRKLLRLLGYRKTGLDFARWVIGRAQELGYIEDTRKTRKPRRPHLAIARAGKNQKVGDVRTGGRPDSQPSMLRSRWWRVFRVPAITRVVAPYSPYPTPAYAATDSRLLGVPRQRSVSVSVLHPSRAPEPAEGAKEVPPRLRAGCVLGDRPSVRGSFHGRKSRMRRRGREAPRPPDPAGQPEP